MAQRSSVAQLPTELLDELHGQIRDGRLTIDELTAFLRERGAEVSRTAVGRYAHSYEKVLAKTREAQDVAGVWVKELHDRPDDKVGQLLAELLKTLAFSTMTHMGEADQNASPMDLHFLARTIKDVAATQKTSADLEIRLRERIAKETVAKLDEAAKGSAEKGISAERYRELRRELLGVGS